MDNDDARSRWGKNLRKTLYRFKVLPLDPSESRQGRRGILIPRDHPAWLPHERCGATDKERNDFLKRLKEGVSEVFVQRVATDGTSPSEDVWEVELTGEELDAIDQRFLEWADHLRKYHETPDSSYPPIVTMIVISTLKNVIYGQIDTGIEGVCDNFTSSDSFLRRWQPKTLGENVDFAEIAAGDCLAGVIVNLDSEKKLVKIDPIKLIQMVDHDPALSFQILSLSKNVQVLQRTRRNQKKRDPFGIQIALRGFAFRSFFLVEDDKPLASSIKLLLKDTAKDTANPISTTVANTMEEANLRIANNEVSQCECAIIDISLATSAQEVDIHGLEILRTLQNKQPKCKYLLMTGISPLDLILERLAPGDSGPIVHGFLQKPFTRMELLSALREISEQPDVNLRQYITQQSKSNKDSDFSPPILPDDNIFSKSICMIISRLRKDTNADSCFLFEMNPMKLHHGQIYAKDAPKECFTSISFRYQYSPISDVALRREQFDYTHDPLKHEKKHYWLFRMHPTYAWCIGIPVPAKGTMRYALFLFRHNSQASTDDSCERRISIRTEQASSSFGALDLAKACKAAGDIGVLLTTDAFENLLYRERVLGKHAITNAFYIHQVRSSINTLNFETPRIKEILAQKEQAPAQMTAEIKTHVDIMLDALSEAKDMEDRIRAEHLEPGKGKMLLSEILDRACGYTQPYLDMKKVILEKDYAKAKSIYVDVVQREVAQAFHNLLANATELLDLFGRNEGFNERWRMGKVRVSYLSEAVPGSENMARIIVSDTGPGIHFFHWDIIWDAGITTKKDGTGLGLTFAQRVLAECKGRIFVRQSVLFVGTAFEVWLPIYSRKAMET